ncbi:MULTISPECIES: hypothetical protein [Vibrio]|uniref:hypothetical protein n=1 Tax=Vibrio TaxID=662 RepID=UPI0001543A78|nr:hypothetical protein [Vibrio sp. B1FIG11]EDL69795.1 hypothetical protein A1Q_1495 [Vibrio campbellii HY01]CAD7823931.1 hypothetical protein ACOMICROBIO_LMKGKHOH_05155 [Vibrio sp. B1FIG11]CAE6950998.1 hypothetical protein ACOMICROBIO_LMKGKHOH_05155 [Vibrio sp. B1FIG11]
MDRGIRDEGFVRRAFDEVKGEDGRWIANQGAFEGSDSDVLDPVTHAAFVTSASIYNQHGKLPDGAVTEAVAAKSIGEVRAFIDKYSSFI